MLDYIIGASLGLVSGFAFYRLSMAQIKKRTDDVSKQSLLKNPLVLPLWMLITALLFAATIWKVPDTLTRIEYLIYISIAMNVSAVDYVVRKIPNESLLVLMLTKLAVIIYILSNGGDLLETIKAPLIGLGVSFVLYILPAFTGIAIGAGDVKYCGVIGFCIGIYSFLQAMIIMAVALLFYLAYLLITKKGNLKTPTAMGPYLSLGVVLTMLFPMF